MNPQTVLGIFLPLFLSLMVAIGGVIVFRGSYYKSLSKRVDELEDKDHKSYTEIQRLRNENETLRRIVTGEVALEQLVELDRLHENKANERHRDLFLKLEELKRVIKNAQ